MVNMWKSYSPCKLGVGSSIPVFSSLSDESLNRGPVSVGPYTSETHGKSLKKWACIFPMFYGVVLPASKN